MCARLPVEGCRTAAESEPDSCMSCSHVIGLAHAHRLHAHAADQVSGGDLQVTSDQTRLSIVWELLVGGLVAVGSLRCIEPHKGRQQKLASFYFC